MNLEDALSNWPGGGNNQSGGGALWPNQPGQPSCPAWPGQGGPTPGWPGPPQVNQGGAHPGWPGPPQVNQGGTHPGWPGGQSGGHGGPGGNRGGNNPSYSGQISNPSGPLSVPYNLTLPRGVYEKLLITINGTVKPHCPDKFTVDVSADRDIAFHFNPRFNECGKKVIVCNSLVDARWGKEERDCTHFPFAPGQQFELKILCTNNEFKVAVNGTHLLEYKHRLRNLASIKQVSVYNDLTLSSVRMDNLP